MEVVSEGSINSWIVPHLSIGETGKVYKDCIGNSLQAQNRLPGTEVTYLKVLCRQMALLVRDMPPLREWAGFG